MTEMAIQAVLQELTDAWNAGDAEAYARLFTEDADYVTFFGMNFPGRATIESSHRALFEGPLRGVKLTGGGEAKIRFLRPDVAVAVVGGGSSLAGEAAPDPGRASTVTFVMVEDDGWRIASFQNTRVSDPAAA